MDDGVSLDSITQGHFLEVAFSVANSTLSLKHINGSYPPAWSALCIFFVGQPFFCRIRLLDDSCAFVLTAFRKITCTTRKNGAYVAILVSLLPLPSPSPHLQKAIRFDYACPHEVALLTEFSCRSSSPHLLALFPQSSQSVFSLSIYGVGGANTSRAVALSLNGHTLMASEATFTYNVSVGVLRITLANGTAPSICDEFNLHWTLDDLNPDRFPYFLWILIPCLMLFTVGGIALLFCIYRSVSSTEGRLANTSPKASFEQESQNSQGLRCRAHLSSSRSRWPNRVSHGITDIPFF